MILFIITFIIIIMAMLAMGIGLIFRKREIRGTCGGLSQMAATEQSCESCCRDPGHE